jgi:hypothetical protein
MAFAGIKQTRFALPSRLFSPSSLRIPIALHIFCSYHRIFLLSSVQYNETTTINNTLAYKTPQLFLQPYPNLEKRNNTSFGVHFPLGPSLSNPSQASSHLLALLVLPPCHRCSTLVFSLPHLHDSASHKTTLVGGFVCLLISLSLRSLSTIPGPGTGFLSG